jgi:hypothetical protein
MQTFQKINGSYKLYSWEEWLELKKKILIRLPLPSSILLDEAHFADFANNYADIYPIESFSINSLSDEEAIVLLYLLDSYFMECAFNGSDERLLSEVYCALRKRFDLTLNPNEDFDLPPKMIEIYSAFIT